MGIYSSMRTDSSIMSDDFDLGVNSDLCMPKNDHLRPQQRQIAYLSHLPKPLSVSGREAPQRTNAVVIETHP